MSVSSILFDYSPNLSSFFIEKILCMPLRNEDDLWRVFSYLSYSERPYYFRHFKGGCYSISGVAYQATDGFPFGPCIIYRPFVRYRETFSENQRPDVNWVRHFSDFLAEVVIDNDKEPRFRLECVL